MPRRRRAALTSLAAIALVAIAALASLAPTAAAPASDGPSTASVLAVETQTATATATPDDNLDPPTAADPNLRTTTDGPPHFSCTGDAFRTPNIKPSTHGIDHWTLIFIDVPTSTADNYRMPALPSEPCVEPAEDDE